MEFEWDLPKAELNLRKHGVSFDDAKAVFDDPLTIEWPDDCDHEERSILIGQFHSRFYYVVYTERQPKIRLISARRATKNEQARYYYENFS